MEDDRVSTEKKIRNTPPPLPPRPNSMEEPAFYKKVMLKQESVARDSLIAPDSTGPTRLPLHSEVHIPVFSDEDVVGNPTGLQFEVPPALEGAGDLLPLQFSTETVEQLDPDVSQQSSGIHRSIARKPMQSPPPKRPSLTDDLPQNEKETFGFIRFGERSFARPKPDCSPGPRISSYAPSPIGSDAGFFGVDTFEVDSNAEDQPAEAQLIDLSSSQQAVKFEDDELVSLVSPFRKIHEARRRSITQHSSGDYEFIGKPGFPATNSSEIDQPSQLFRIGPIFPRMVTNFAPDKVSQMRDHFLSEEYEKCTSQFSVKKVVEIACITWNVGAKGTESQKNFIEFLRDALGNKARNVVAVGFQEAIHLNAMNVLADTMADRDNPGKEILYWQALVQACLDALSKEWDSETYVLLSSSHLVGLCMFVFIQEQLLGQTKYLQKEVIPTGVGGFLGNKGGIAIRFDLHQTSMCFVCAHFAAHSENVQERNEEYRIISSRPCFLDLELNPKGLKRASSWTVRTAAPKTLNQVTRKSLNVPVAKKVSEDDMVLSRRTSMQKDQDNGSWFVRDGKVSSYPVPPAHYLVNQAPYKSSSQPGVTSSQKISRKVLSRELLPTHSNNINCLDILTPLDHDYVFWMGDLNYRMIQTATIAGVIDLAKHKYLDTLIKFDQLIKEKEAGRIFQGFQEGVLKFPPTYKFIPGTDEYDQRPEKKLRCPSWTDRILYRSKPICKIEQIEYNCGNLTLSDHKPVYALFSTELAIINEETREIICSDILRRWKEWMTEKVATCSIIPELISIKQLHVDKCEVFSLQLNNTSKHQPLHYEMRPAFPPWIIPPSNLTGIIQPSCSEVLIIEIDGKLAHREGGDEKRGSISTVLVFQIENGNDLYLPVACELLEKTIPEY